MTSSRRHACARSSARTSSIPGTRLDRWLFSILRSIWLNEIRARKIREGGGFVDAEEALSVDGARAIESNILAGQVLTAISRLPEAQRETVLLVYAEGYSYAEAANALGDPDRHGDEPPGHGEVGAGESEVGRLGKNNDRRRPGACRADRQRTR